MDQSLVEMPYLPPARKESSLQKWERILDLVQRRVAMPYIKEFWRPCGFCLAATEFAKALTGKSDPFFNCRVCALFSDGGPAGMTICVTYGDKYSYAHKALMYAEAGMGSSSPACRWRFWYDAADAVKVVIEAIWNTEAYEKPEDCYEKRGLTWTPQ